MQLLLTTLYDFLIISCIAISFFFIYAPSKIFHIAHASSITLGGYVFYTYYEDYGAVISLSFVFLFSIFYSLVLYSLYIKIILKEENRLISLVLSIGIYVVTKNTISIIYGDTLKLTHLFEEEVIYVFNEIFISISRFISILVSISLIIISLYILKASKLGIYIKALSVDLELSNIYGVNRKKIYLIVIILGTILAALIGVLINIDMGVTPSTGFTLFLYGMVAMIIGGTNNIGGILVGSLILSISQNMTSYFLHESWKDVMTFILLIIYLYAQPHGYAGMKHKKANI